MYKASIYPVFDLLTVNSFGSKAFLQSSSLSSYYLCAFLSNHQVSHYQKHHIPMNIFSIFFPFLLVTSSRASVIKLSKININITSESHYDYQNDKLAPENTSLPSLLFCWRWALSHCNHNSIIDSSTYAHCQLS